MTHLVKQGIIIATPIPRALKAGSVETDIRPTRHAAVCGTAPAPCRPIPHGNCGNQLEMVDPQPPQGTGQGLHLGLVSPVNLYIYTADIDFHVSKLKTPTRATPISFTDHLGHRSISEGG